MECLSLFTNNLITKKLTNQRPTIQVTISLFSLFGGRIVKHISQNARTGTVGYLKRPRLSYALTPCLAFFRQRGATTGKTGLLIW